MRYLAWFLIFVMAASSQAASPEEDYFAIYAAITDAEVLGQNGQLKRAFDKYAEAETSLKRLQTSNPTWNSETIKFRLNYLAQKLQGISEKGGNKRQNEPNPSVAVEDPKGVNASNAPDTALERIRNLEAENAALQAKVKEAFSVQNSRAKNSGLEKAESRILELQKERDVLRISLDELKNKQATIPDTKKQTAQLEKELKTVRSERDDALDQLVKLKKELENRSRKSESSAADQAKEETKAISEKFAVQIKELKDQVKLRDDSLREAQKNSEKLTAKVAALEKDLDKTKGNKSPKGNKEIESLKARIAVYEAKATPFNSEELALLKMPSPSVRENETAASEKANENKKPASVPAKKDTKQLPPGAGPLVADAERAFAQKRFEEAEKKYLQVLSQDESNVYVLANLGAIQMEMGRYDEAEKNIKKALENDPEDAYSLTLLGMLKFRQDKFDEALDFLSRSAQLNPNHAETQNYLGITLSQKGQRGPAEAALRKALLLQPNYANAHHNLAIVYATQKPPFLELARYHYQKAVSLGQMKNPQFETLLQGN